MSDVMDFLNMSEEDGRKAATDQRAKARAGTFTFDNSFYPLTKIPVGASSRIRFLADGYKDTYPNFWVVKKVFPIQFAIADSDKFFKLNIPCREMYVTGKDACPLASMIRPMFQEAEALKKKGRTKESKDLHGRASGFWMDTQRIAQGFVVKSGLNEQNAPENPIRFFSIGKKLFKVMNMRIDPPEGMEDQMLPYWAAHPKLGTDLIVAVTMQGEFRNYDTSHWSQTQTALTEAQTQAVVKYGLTTLSTKLPTQPSDDEYKLFSHMLEQALNGNSVWDPDWETELKTVKPFKINADGTSARDSSDSNNIQSRVRAALGSDDGEEATPAATTLSAVNRSVRTDEAEATVSEPVKPTVTPHGAAAAGSALVNSIRERMAKSKAS